MSTPTLMTIKVHDGYYIRIPSEYFKVITDIKWEGRLVRNGYDYPKEYVTIEKNDKREFEVEVANWDKDKLKKRYSADDYSFIHFEGYTNITSYRTHPTFISKEDLEYLKNLKIGESEKVNC